MKPQSFNPHSRWDRRVPASDSHPELLDEKIEVLAFFRSGRIIPRLFIWSNKEYAIEKVAYNWQERLGQAVISRFSVSSCGVVYQISFNNEALGWRLDKVF